MPDVNLELVSMHPNMFFGKPTSDSNKPSITHLLAVS
jgi:hypothetical protein